MDLALHIFPGCGESGAGLGPQETSVLAPRGVLIKTEECQLPMLAGAGLQDLGSTPVAASIPRTSCNSHFLLRGLRKGWPWGLPGRLQGVGKIWVCWRESDKDWLS